MASDPRWKSGKRRKYQARFKAMGLNCAICGRPIDYTLPYYVKDAAGRRHVNMLAFVIDEKTPVSKWREGGFNSPQEAAESWENLRPCHAICNAKKYNKTDFSLKMEKPKRKAIRLDGEW